MKISHLKSLATTKARPFFASIGKFLNSPGVWASIFLLGISGPSHAGMYDNALSMFCAVVGPLVGPKSTLMSMVLVLVAAIFLIMWWLNESKEGVMIWIIRTGAIVTVIVNIFSLPTYMGMAPITC